MVKVKVGIVQMAVTFGEPALNRERARELIARAAAGGADLVALPETWNVGFFPENVGQLADQDGEPTKTIVSTWAREYNINIWAGSVAVVRKGKLYNTSYVFDRQGNLVSGYDKSHLFTPAGEHNTFTAGSQTVVFDLEGIAMARLSAMISGFPNYCGPWPSREPKLSWLRPNGP